MPDNGRDNSRLDRVEAILEMLAQRQAGSEDEHRRLLRAQVVLVDTVQRLADSQIQSDARLDALADAQRHTEERMNALIAVVDGLVRRPSPPPA